MSISTPFIRRPIATSLLMIAILLVGMVAYPALPVAPLPQVDFPTIVVTTNYPGASPVTMASSVAQPLERTFSQIPGVTQLTSISGSGVVAIIVSCSTRCIRAPSGLRGRGRRRHSNRRGGPARTWTPGQVDRLPNRP